MINTDIEKEFEGCKLTAYQDSVGVWTIGFGHTSGVYEGQVITQEQADEFLLSDLRTAINAVESLVKVPINDEQKSALVDLVFNIGQGNFAGSTLLKLLNKKQYELAAKEFLRWNRAGGVVLAGLVRRRAAESEMFRKGIENGQS